MTDLDRDPLPDLPALRELQRIIARLRAPDGCPWDRKQTITSMAPHLLEETHEALDAIRAEAMDGTCEELGDVLMNVLLIAQIAAEEGHFDLEQVARQVGDKLVRRHPHVFGDGEAEDTDEVLTTWEAIKRQEKGGAPRGALAGIPSGLPALHKAYRVGEKAARTGFDWPDARGPREKLDEEIGELDRALASGEGVAEEFGDVLFSVVNLARHHKVQPEEALAACIERFSSRFRFVEERLGARLSEASLEEMETAWAEAKRREGG